MLVDNITQTITEIPMAGKRGVDVQTIFVNKQEAFQDALTEVFVEQINTLRTQLNTFVGQLNTTTTQINTDATSATNAAEIATAKNNEIKNVSVGSTITGMPGTPASVTYSPITGKFTFVIPRGEAFQVDARGALTDRSLYDTKYPGFGFLALDESKIYFKMSNTSGDWSVGLYFGKGDGIVSTVFTSTTDPSGLAGQSGATDTYTINYSNLETDTFIVKNGEDGLDNITDTVIGTETTWSSTKIKNLLAQKADKVELDQRIDSLGSTTVKLTDNQTIDGVKTFSSNIVGSINGNSTTVTNGVYTTGDQTISGVKTFSSSPIVPTPTTGTQVANKDYVDSSSTLPIGTILNGYTIFNNCIVAFGGEFNRADYPKLWAYLQANPTLLKTQAQWTTENNRNGMCGYFSNGNGTTTFRVPNLDKAFLRPDSRTVGSFEGDAIRNITGSALGRGLKNEAYGQWEYTTGVFREILGETKAQALQTVDTTFTTIRGLEINASNVVPTANENRPKNIAVLPLIVAK